MKNVVTRDDDVQDEADILPGGLDSWNVGDEAPYLLVFLVDVDDAFPHELHGLGLLHLEVCALLLLLLSQSAREELTSILR